jgi:hypothetical protein
MWGPHKGGKVRTPGANALEGAPSSSLFAIRKALLVDLGVWALANDHWPIVQAVTEAIRVEVLGDA